MFKTRSRSTIVLNTSRNEPDALGALDKSEAICFLFLSAIKFKSSKRNPMSRSRSRSRSPDPELRELYGLFLEGIERPVLPPRVSRERTPAAVERRLLANPTPAEERALATIERHSGSPSRSRTRSRSPNRRVGRLTRAPSRAISPSVGSRSSSRSLSRRESPSSRRSSRSHTPLDVVGYGSRSRSRSPSRSPSRSRSTFGGPSRSPSRSRSRSPVRRPPPAGGGKCARRAPCDPATSTPFRTPSGIACCRAKRVARGGAAGGAARGGARGGARAAAPRCAKPSPCDQWPNTTYFKTAGNLGCCRAKRRAA